MEEERFPLTVVKLRFLRSISKMFPTVMVSEDGGGGIGGGGIGLGGGPGRGGSQLQFVLKLSIIHLNLFSYYMNGKENCVYLQKVFVGETQRMWYDKAIRWNIK